MNVYVYAADLFCEDCGEAIRARIDKEGQGPNWPDDETSYDSDEYPKGPYPSDESDYVGHCAAGEDCLNAIQLPDRKIGAWLENPLTVQGEENTREAIREGGDVAELWAEYYPHLER
jgi:hypothetical protein